MCQGPRGGLTLQFMGKLQAGGLVTRSYLGRSWPHLGPERGQGSEKVQRGVRGRAALVGPSTSFGFRSSLFTLPSQTPPSPVPR